jgi:hypothetical protein
VCPIKAHRGIPVNERWSLYTKKRQHAHHRNITSDDSFSQYDSSLTGHIQKTVKGVAMRNHRAMAARTIVGYFSAMWPSSAFLIHILGEKPVGWGDRGVDWGRGGGSRAGRQSWSWYG